MTSGEVGVIVSFVAAVIACAVIAVGWLRERTWPVRRDVQRKADESRARVACAPQLPHVEAWPSQPPCSERIIDVIQAAGR